MKITVDQLDVLVLRKQAVEFADSINAALERFDINTPPRICHFLAQILHESGNLVYMEEIASGKAYEGRKDLGNIHTGDGVRFKGRGAIQITGRANYELISKDLGIDFVKRPELLSNKEYALLSAGWFWTKKDLNRYADMPDTSLLTYRKVPNLRPIEVISRIINGGTNGLSDRVQKYTVLKSLIK